MYWIVYSLSARYGFDINETFVPETRPLPIEQFKLRDSHNENKDLKLWLEEIEREFRYFRINSPTDKKDALIKQADEEEILSLQISGMRYNESGNEVRRHDFQQTSVNNEDSPCGYCGLAGVHIKVRGCPAYKKQRMSSI